MKRNHKFGLAAIGILSISATIVLAQHSPPADHSVAGTPPAAEQSNHELLRLVAGNKRFETGQLQRPNTSVARRNQIAQGQKPFAVIVTCSDSRLCPEIIFDQGLGDLFVVRVAGNTVDKVEMGSIEYAVEHLGATLVVVMGHERCGAVDAALKGGDLPGSLPSVVAPIKHAVERTAGVPAEHRLEFTVSENVRDTCHQIEESELVGHLVHQGKVQVVGMHYDLETGKARQLLDGVSTPH